ncbi:chorismate mutase [Mesorhizobium sp. WSM3224]|uniref:chorismate mutase n=1 Tax=Mesorhizobium sp. WSM3224 TaxID=1040986 RepID=UPI000487B077|nr:chorismate mutase [Mesorhizobium sp. WSM3224]
MKKDLKQEVRLAEHRNTIDNIDAAIIHMLAERFRCTEEVGFLKAQYGYLPQDKTRETAQTTRLRDLALSAGLDPELAEAYLRFVVAHSVSRHEAIANLVAHVVKR